MAYLFVKSVEQIQSYDCEQIHHNSMCIQSPWILAQVRKPKLRNTLIWAVILSLVDGNEEGNTKRQEADKHDEERLDDLQEHVGVQTPYL